MHQQTGAAIMVMGQTLLGVVQSPCSTKKWLCDAIFCATYSVHVHDKSITHEIQTHVQGFTMKQ